MKCQHNLKYVLRGYKGNVYLLCLFEQKPLGSVTLLTEENVSSYNYSLVDIIKPSILYKGHQNTASSVVVVVPISSHYAYDGISINKTFISTSLCSKIFPLNFFLKDSVIIGGQLVIPDINIIISDPLFFVKTRTPIDYLKKIMEIMFDNDESEKKNLSLIRFPLLPDSDKNLDFKKRKLRQILRNIISCFRNENPSYTSIYNKINTVEKNRQYKDYLPVKMHPQKRPFASENNLLCHPLLQTRTSVRPLFACRREEFREKNWLSRYADSGKDNSKKTRNNEFGSGMDMVEF